MAIDFLLITPPFCQTNTPYPATAYLSAFLKEKRQSTAQIDLGIKLLGRIFSSSGLSQLYAYAEHKYIHKSKNPLLRESCFIQQKAYLDHIEGVIAFLKASPSSSIPVWINQLPKGQFLTDSIQTSQLNEFEIARHRCTLFLEDISEFIKKHIDTNFGFNRYGEQLGRSAYSFDAYAQALASPVGILEKWMLELLQKTLVSTLPSHVAFTIPFPGNLLSTLRCAQYIRVQFPAIRIIMGGGFVNTELREIKDTRFFEFCDHLCFDDGEDALELYLNDPHNAAQCIVPTKSTPFSSHAIPDYTGIDLSEYFSVLPISNPMHLLWNDGRWIKMILAHGCYWGKCSFCDGSLPYISRYDPQKAETIVDNMELLMEQQRKALLDAGLTPDEEDYNGFHFVDEAAPPILLRKISEIILARGLRVRWWTNIRFEKKYDQALCSLMAQAGCIAVAGGLEVASPRILELIGKGVTIEQAFEVCEQLSAAGILVHAYLMYGFPSQTKAETMESLENVRLLFEKKIIQSAFWHRFALTAHSPMGANPEKFYCILETQPNFEFAKNDLLFRQTCGANHDLFTDGLNKALYNYMHGEGLHLPLSHWFR